MPPRHEEEHIFEENEKREYSAYDALGNALTLERRIFKCVYGCGLTYDTTQLSEVREEVTSNVE